MSRIASVKETGEELSQADWERFERAVEVEVEQRPKEEPSRHGPILQDSGYAKRASEPGKTR